MLPYILPYISYQSSCLNSYTNPAQTLVQTLAQTLALMDISMLEYGWLFPHHLFQMLNFRQSLPKLNRSTYRKDAIKSPLCRVPKSDGHPKSMNKLTLNEPAIS